MKRAEPADRIFVNCRVYTLDPANSRSEAIAVRDAKIAAVGPVDRVRQLAGPDAEEIDLRGRTVVPGLIDAHNHLVHYGVSATRSADLSGSRSIEEVLDRLRTFRQQHPDMPWLLGRRFDQELFAEGRWITRADLDRISPSIPIMVTRLCLHALVANSAALHAVESRLSGRQRETGILIEDATGLVWDQIPPPTERELERAAVWALGEARKVGLSEVHCQIETAADLDVLRKLRERDSLPVRVRVQCPFEMIEELAGQDLRTGSGDEFLRIGSVKVYMDGGMGARTAALKEPFSDDPGNYGDLLANEQELAEMLREIQRAGCQAAVHAIGDRAVECALRGIGLAMDDGNRGNALRHRIEHASQMDEDLLVEMARLNVPAVVQPQFVITDFWTYERVGPRRYAWSNPFRSMLAAGILLALGSDCPVERLDPVELVDRAVNREHRSLGERLSVEETLRAYACGGAYVGFEEGIKGPLEVGKLADFCVLSEDPFEIDPSRLGEISIEQCVVGGSLR